MDKTDTIMCQLLLANSRLSYRELAGKLNLSVTAVHKRIQALIDRGIIRKFTANLSAFAQNAIHVFIFGYSKANPVSSLASKLEKHGSIYWLAVGGGNMLYIGVYLKQIGELDALVRYIKETAQIPEPTVGITGSPMAPHLINLKIPKGGTTLCELDYKIICSLQENSRKPTSEIAHEIGVSTKTVQRRLTRMKNNYLVEFSMQWYPDASNDIISIFQVNLKCDSAANVPNIILQKFYPNTLFYWSFSNIPNSYIFMVWTPTSKELKEIREKIEQDISVQSILPNVIYTGYIFNCWRNEIPC